MKIIKEKLKELFLYFLLSIDNNKADKNGYTPLGAAKVSPFMSSELK